MNRRQRSVERFCARLPTFASIIDCWPMQTTRPDGYATYGNRSVFTELAAHRIVWTELNGPIPEDWEVDHWCHTHNCVNPLHLRACPRAENRLWAPWGRERCSHGHLKTYVNPNTGRAYCRECIRAATRAWLDKDGNRERQNEMRRARRASLAA